MTICSNELVLQNITTDCYWFSSKYGYDTQNYIQPMSKNFCTCFNRVIIKIYIFTLFEYFSVQDVLANLDR